MKGDLSVAPKPALDLRGWVAGQHPVLSGSCTAVQIFALEMFALGTLFDTCYTLTHIISVNHLTPRKACSMCKFLSACEPEGANCYNRKQAQPFLTVLLINTSCRGAREAACC